MTALSAEKPLLKRSVLLAVCGSVAACRADRIIRELQRQGAEVQVLLTKSGSRFFTPFTAGSLSDYEVIQEQFDAEHPERMVHIDVKRNHDCVLVAPATANRLLELDRPQASDTLGTVLQAFSGPVLYAPAMNPDMWLQSSVQRVIDEYRDQIIAPEEDEVACGDVGPGHLRDPVLIVEHVVRSLWPDPLKGQHWILSGGPTREPWDVIRFLSNRSSGRMGEALALVADRLGANVDYVTGSRNRFYPAGTYRVFEVETTRDMLEQIDELMSEAAAYLGAAAVSDYRPRAEQGKVRSGQGELSLELEENPDILEYLASSYPESIRVGFSADAASSPDRALEKARRKDLDAIVFNSILQEEGGFDRESNRAFFCLPDGMVRPLGKRNKLSMALQIWLSLLDTVLF